MNQRYRISRVFIGMFVCAILILVIHMNARCETANSGQILPTDAKGCPFEKEIGTVLRLGYMNPTGDNAFKPDGKVRAADFVTCITKSAAKSGISINAFPQPSTPKADLTRQEAVKLLVSSLLTSKEIDEIGLQCGGAPPYLSDFLDAGDVASWAEPFYAAAIYKGWLTDRYRLHPKEEATRGFVASILARAFPDNTAYTGLAVCVNPSDLKRSMSIQIATLGTEPDIVYPTSSCIPSIAFTGAPGLASYSASIEEGKLGRLGKNPLIVTASGVQRGKGGVMQLVISPEDAATIRAANETGLFLDTWKVAILPTTVTTPPIVQQASAK